MNKLSQFWSRSSTRSQDSKRRKHVPWISGPLDPEHHKDKQEIHTLRLATSHKDVDPVFKRHHESSPIELFYDLFFVANLATFTMNHEIFDAESLKSYLGFFTLMWFVWFQISLFDVRFASDSVFHRVCKVIQFGGMAGFALVGSAYDTTDLGTNASAFRGIAIILMLNRLVLFFQYGMVLFYVKNYPRTHAPLLTIMGTLFVAAMVYLGTFFGFYGTASTFIVWYVFACIEVTVIIAASSRWRVLSFTKTHLVERVGLLTLIIMGEGIFGLAKSAAWILQNTNEVTGRDAGVLIAAVLLIYYIWSLYFDQIDHERFGTVRQQIWAVLHYPLHAFILGTVEGSTNLLLWNIIGPISRHWVGMYRTLPSPGLASSPEVVEYLNSSLEVFLKQFKGENPILNLYNYTEDINTIQEITFPANSPAWTMEANVTMSKMWIGVINAIFASYEVATPELPEDATQEDKLNAYTGTFDTVFTYFYICSGLFLIAIAVLYVFGKGWLRRSEWGSVGVRVFAGVGLSLVIVPLYYLPYDNAEDNTFVQGPWHIIIVMLVYGIVIVLDNLLIFQTNKKIPISTNDAERGTDSDLPMKAPECHAQNYSPVSQVRV